MQLARQRGGALLVAMVMIFMLSIMGVSVMRSSTLEKRMAINAIQSSATFQAAESASNLALNDFNHLNSAHMAGSNTPVVLAIDEVHADIGLQSVSTVEWVGTGPLPGFSTGDFQALYYIATGVSAIDSARSQATVEQGAYRGVPHE